MSINALVLTGEGINCAVETAFAFETAGAKTKIIHLDDFLKLESLDDCDILAIPGGFSYGDEIRSGKIVAELIKLHQEDNFENFIKQKKPIIGICNGFQILCQLGVFNTDSGNKVTLAENQNGKFINKWTDLEIKNSHCLWLKEIKESLFMPIRHKEGRITGKISQENIAIKYTNDENGSLENIAALTNSEGNILGIMPHPEAALQRALFPYKKEKAPINLSLFKNAIAYTRRLKDEKSSTKRK